MGATATADVTIAVDNDAATASGVEGDEGNVTTANITISLVMTTTTSPDGAYRWLHAKPLYAAIGRVLAPYRPGGRHGHRRRRRLKTHTKHNF